MNQIITENPGHNFEFYPKWKISMRNFDFTLQCKKKIHVLGVQIAKFLVWDVKKSKFLISVVSFTM